MYSSQEVNFKCLFVVAPVIRVLICYMKYRRLYQPLQYKLELQYCMILYQVQSCVVIKNILVVQCTLVVQYIKWKPHGLPVVL